MLQGISRVAEQEEEEEVKKVKNRQHRSLLLLLWPSRCCTNNDHHSVTPESPLIKIRVFRVVVVLWKPGLGCCWCLLMNPPTSLISLLVSGQCSTSSVAERAGIVQKNGACCTTTTQPIRSMDHSRCPNVRRLGHPQSDHLPHLVLLYSKHTSFQYGHVLS